MVKRVDICIGGFTQTRNNPSGIDKVYLDNVELKNSHITLICNWKDDWKSLARFLFRIGPDDLTLDVRVYAYSWGCGYAFIRLAKELKKMGIKIRYAVLSDPVYFNRLFRWRAMYSPFWIPKIMVPDNVQKVYYFVQRQNLPSGHKVKAVDENLTKVYFMGELKYTHQYMDDAPEFRLLCRKVSQIK